jgi:hypothetical protein
VPRRAGRAASCRTYDRESKSLSEHLYEVGAAPIAEPKLLEEALRGISKPELLENSGAAMIEQT